MHGFNKIIPYRKSAENGNANRIKKDYINLILKEPKIFIKTKWDFIKRSMGIGYFISNSEYNYNRDEQMHEFGMIDTEIRKSFFDSYNDFQNKYKYIRKPILVFLISLLVMSLCFKFCDKNRFKIIIFMFLLAIFYYASFLITTQSHEFRYFFPSFYLLTICVVSATSFLVDYLTPKEITKVYVYIGVIFAIFISISVHKFNIKYRPDIDLAKYVIENGNKFENLDNSLDIYYFENNLYYIADRKSDVKTKFFLHVYPEIYDNLSDNIIKDGFENCDFSFKNRALNIPFWFKYKVAKVSLPDKYIIDRMTMGQFTYDGKKFNNIWTKEIKFDDMIPQIKTVQSVNFTDNNWQKGISNDHKVILLDKPFIEYYSIIGKRLKLVDGNTVNIVDVKIKDKWTHIILDRAIDLKNSYPNELNIIE